MATNVNKIGKSLVKIRIINGIYKDDLKVAKSIPYRYVIRYSLESITGVLPRQTRQVATGVGNIKFPKAAQQSKFFIQGNQVTILELVHCF